MLLAAAAVIIVIAVVFWLALIGVTVTNGDYIHARVKCMCRDKHTHFLLLCFCGMDSTTHV